MDNKHKELDKAYKKVVDTINSTTFSDAHPNEKEKLLQSTKKYYEIQVNPLKEVTQ